MLETAIEIANNAHHGQRRTGTNLPYIVHPLNVMQILIDHHWTNERTLCTAVLHDVIEDCAPSYGEDVRSFSKWVHNNVVSLTKRETALDTLVRLHHAEPEAQLVKLADIYDNCRNGELYDGYFRKKRRQMEMLHKVSHYQLYDVVMDVLK